MRVAVIGAGIAGPTLAWWLSRAGHDVMLVEESPVLRTAGYVVDFWGLGYDIAERMGVLPEICELGYRFEEVRFVNDRGRKLGGFRAGVFRRATGDRFISVRRADISATIFGALGDRVETIFGDTVSAIDDDGTRVRLTFEHAPPREVDLVVGADGLHSRVRQLAFPQAADPEVSLGYQVAAFAVPGYRPRDELVFVTYGLPGRQLSRFAMRGDTTLFLGVFRDQYLPGALPTDDAGRKAAVRHVFGGLGWECPRILAAMVEVDGVYFDRVSQIRLDRWTTGRTALVGDAAACVSLLAGEGTGLAMTEAYVLAGELAQCGGDHRAAFSRYETRLMPFLRQKQRMAEKFASSFAPGTALGIAVRNVATRLLDIPVLGERFISSQFQDDFELPDYGLPGSRTP
jgi:2-polyprenyl-6-methoxyphenol hydroxylase-like FAD-dependent oxidoreductase